MYHSYKEELDIKGVTTIPDVFTADECDEMKAAAYATTDEQIANSGYPHIPSEQAYNKKSLIFFPALANPILNKYRIDQRMVDIVQSFLGDNVRQINNQVYFREAEDLDTFAWHRDTIFRESGVFTGSISSDYLQTIIAIDDITPSNGAVEFIEGSHMWPIFPVPKNLRQFNRQDLHGTKYTATRGSVMLWSVNIIHGSEANTSGNSRMTYMNGFCRTASAKTYPDYLVDGEVVSNINAKAIP